MPDLGIREHCNDLVHMNKDNADAADVTLGLIDITAFAIAITINNDAK